jgi:drug/metabolite transporter (DMT)-like permease
VRRGLHIGHAPVMTDNAGRAAVTILLSALSFSMVGVMVRLSGEIPVIEKVFFRSVVSLVAMGALAFRYRENPFTQGRLIPALILRGVFGTGAMILYFYAIGNLNLADATILNKLSPFFVTVFAVVFLKEKLARHLIPALLLAFVGALLVLKPQLDYHALPAVGGLASAMCSGAAYTVVRSLRGKLPPYTVVFWFSVVSVVAVAVPTALGYARPTPAQWLALLGAGVFATAGQFTLTYAYHQALASRLSIYNYAHVVFAGILALILWGEVPDALSLVGIALIMSAAVWNHRHMVRETAAAALSG